MMAETVHSLADCGNQLLLLLGLKQAKRPPSPDYPLGYGKEIYFWSFLVALMLFSVGGMFSVYEGWHKLHNPEPIKHWYWAAGVLTFGIIAEAVSLRACMQEVNKARGDRSLWRWFRESRQAELVVIFGEDLAALFGLVFALIAIGLTVATGNPLWDAIGTIAIGVLLIVVAVFVAVEVKALLIGQSVDWHTQQAIREYLESRPQVAKVRSLITLQLGSDMMVSVHAEMRDAASPREMIDGINAIEAGMKERFPQVRWSFFEPEMEGTGAEDQDYVPQETS
jgi:cation diffusion facilitator family transporter